MTLKKDKKDEIRAKFLEVQKKFPFGQKYMNGSLKKYNAIISEIMNNSSSGSNILSIGSGPCDLEAILSKLGYTVTAIDDLNDHWHLIGKNRERIRDFAKRMNIKLIINPADTSEIKKNSFDVVLLVDIIEHLHNSPRELLNYSISLLKMNGILIIEVPNTVELKKRLKVLFGKSNQFSSEFIYWCIGEYRGHIREYTQSELKQILANSNLQSVNSKMLNIASRDTKGKNILDKIKIKAFKIISGFYPNFRDTILISGKKPTNWHLTNPSIEIFKKYYPHIGMYNLDGEQSDTLIKKFAILKG